MAKDFLLIFRFYLATGSDFRQMAVPHIKQLMNLN